MRRGARIPRTSPLPANPQQEPEIDLSSRSAVEDAAGRFREDFSSCAGEIGKVIVGQRDTVESLLTCLFADGHALLEGVPGIGKTLLIRTLGRVLSLSFGRVQFTPDLMPADITGTTVVRETPAGAAGLRREFVFEQGPIFAQLVLADEINRATPKTQSALLEAMQERRVTVSGVTHDLPAPFFVMATQNPIEQEGTYPLPEAQLDRFFFKILVGYADRGEMLEILRRTTTGARAEPSVVLDAGAVRRHQVLVRAVASPENVADYAVRTVLATHSGVSYANSRMPAGEFATAMVKRFVRVGASPRAAQALLLGAKVRALLDGRLAIALEDVQHVAPLALRHRIIMNFESQAEGVSADDVVTNIIDTLPR